MSGYLYNGLCCLSLLSTDYERGEIKMLKLIESWKGAVEVDGVKYDSIQDVISSCKTFSDKVHIVLHASAENVTEKHTDSEKQSIEQSTDRTEYRITVKKYMTQPASIGFDFMQKWNNNKPMPMRIMQGTIEKETRGMVYMKLHGFARQTITCACCGKELTNPVSRYYGIGPVCLAKLGIARQIDDIDNIKEDLAKIERSGWVIKSSITEQEEI